MNKFFISCPLNLANQCLIELEKKWSWHNDSQLPKVELSDSGLELECTMEEGLKLNHYMRSANRVLLRVKEQKCRDLPKLFKIFTKINWKDFLKQEQVSFNISCHQSRLMHTTRIEKTAKDALVKFFNANQIKAKQKEQFKESKPAQIFIRIENDNLTISIDTTGELLYLRDYIKYKAHAPLRNNLAYIMHEFLIQQSKTELSKTSLVDPMCGSGTFLHEAANRSKSLKRSFAYELFHPKVLIQDILTQGHKEILGFELEKEIVAKNNLPFIKHSDLFDGKVSPVKDSVCILNPPYGKKIKIKGERNKFFQKIIHACFNKYECSFLGIIIPNGVTIKKQEHFKLESKLRVFNNGIWVDFWVISSVKS